MNTVSKRLFFADLKRFLSFVTLTPESWVFLFVRPTQPRHMSGLKQTLNHLQGIHNPSLETGSALWEKGEIIKKMEAWVGERVVEPGDMLLMPPFRDTGFWYHALIGQMS